MHAAHARFTALRTALDIASFPLPGGHHRQSRMHGSRMDKMDFSAPHRSVAQGFSLTWTLALSCFLEYRPNMPTPAAQVASVSAIYSSAPRSWPQSALHYIAGQDSPLLPGTSTPHCPTGHR